MIIDNGQLVYEREKESFRNMTKMIFPYQVKYENKYFAANTAFDVKNEDIKSLTSQGGTVLEKCTKSSKKRGLNNVAT